MSSSYLSGSASVRSTPQSEPIPQSGQTQNEAGGYAWEVTPIERLRRWLILGSEGGTYYASQKELTKQNVKALQEALEELGTSAVAEIVKISVQGRAPKADPAIFALAYACAFKHPSDKNQTEIVQRAALDAIPRVCRTGIHLFMFCDFVQQFRGWGPALRKAVAAWYQRDDIQGLSYQLVKYRQRDGWTHRDVMRLCHVKPPTPTHNAAYGWVTQGREDILKVDDAKPIKAHVEAMAAPERSVELLHANGTALPREALDPTALKDAKVWAELVEQGMPMTALLRNLATLTRVGVLKPLSDGTKTVIEQLTDKERLRRARIHPLSVLMALATYRSGHGFRGRNTWEPIGQVIDALDAAFYKSFDYVQPTGKRTLLALDVSGSMGSAIANTMLSCREAAAAMAMVTARTEPNYAVVAFSHAQGAWNAPAGNMGRFTAYGSGIKWLEITPNQRLDDILKLTSELPFGGTDCALPMLFAADEDVEVDVFQILTDNETWAGNIHPAQALNDYRRKTGVKSKLATVAMTAGGHTVGDPNDAGTLNTVGFDTSTPQVISDFVRGDI